MRRFLQVWTKWYRKVLAAWSMRLRTDFAGDTRLISVYFGSQTLNPYARSKGIL